MVAAMVGVGGSVAWQWPIWVVGLIGIGFVVVAVLMTRNTWDQTKTNYEDVMSGIRQLQRLSGIDEASAPRVMESDYLGTYLQRLVAGVSKRMNSLEEERAKIIAIMGNLVEGVVAF